MAAGPAPYSPPAKRGVGRPRFSNTEVRREMIIRAALRVFAYRGYDAATMQEVSELVGITRPAVNHHFPGKACLCRTALHRACEVAITPEAVRQVESFVSLRDELKMAGALLGSSLSHSHRIAQIAPRITTVPTALRGLCQEAVGLTGDDRRVDTLFAVVAGRWLLMACELTLADVQIDIDLL